MSLADGRRLVNEFVEYYNNIRLHSAIGYVAPVDKLEGRAEEIHAERDKNMEAARLSRKLARKKEIAWPYARDIDMKLSGETEAGSAAVQLARDNRNEATNCRMVAVAYCHHFLDNSEL